ncbi:MAG: hypothetical protein VKJ24_02025 [Synechococcales bacterium]|nr:hypothetical protein [Synechococcales bacterium]
MIAVTLILGLLVLYLVYERWRTHQTMRWWELQQAQAAHQTSEYIREHLLQKLFTARRTLELSQLQQSNSVGSPSMASTGQIVDLLHQCQQNLSNLCDRLSLPYDSNHLELALQSGIQQWQSIYPNITITLDLLTNTPVIAISQDVAQDPKTCEPYPELSRTDQAILNWLSHFWAVMLPSSTVKTVVLHLMTTPTQVQVQIQLQAIDQQLLTKRTKDLRSLQQMFIILTKGSCRYHHQVSPPNDSPSDGHGDGHGDGYGDMRYSNRGDRQKRCLPAMLTCTLTWDPQS